MADQTRIGVDAGELVVGNFELIVNFLGGAGALVRIFGQGAGVFEGAAVLPKIFAENAEKLLRHRRRHYDARCQMRGPGDELEEIEDDFVGAEIGEEAGGDYALGDFFRNAGGERLGVLRLGCGGIGHQAASVRGQQSGISQS